MKKSISSGIKLLAFSMLAVCMVEASAQTFVDSVSISKIRTGWGTDTFALETTGFPIANPAGCSSPDGYLADLSTGGYKTHLAAVLMAFSMDKKVTIVVSDVGCAVGRPKIMGIYIEK